MPNDFFGWLRIADAGGLALVAVRLSFGPLLRAYPVLFAHAALETLFSVLSFAISTESLAYAWIFIGFSCVRWGLWLFIAAGLYQSALAPYPALFTVGRLLVATASVMAFVPVLLTRSIDFSHVGPNIRLLPAVFLAERTITAALAILVLALCAFGAWFLIPLRRNSVYLCLGFGVIFVTRSAAFSLRNALGPDSMHLINVLGLLCSIAVFWSWAFLLNPAGEQVTSFLGRRPEQSRLESAIQRLSAVNTELDRARGKK